MAGTHIYQKFRLCRTYMNLSKFLYFRQKHFKGSVIVNQHLLYLVLAVGRCYGR